MPGRDDIQHSILIVSGVERFDALIRKMLRPGMFMSVEFKNNAAAARRCILERYYDLIVVNAPLPDENGVDLVLDMAVSCSASILIIVPSGTYEDVLERVTDHGILALEKPFPTVRLSHAVRFLSAQQAAIRRMEKKVRDAEERTDDLRIIDKAKFLLMEKKHMTEEEAHRFIGKKAMDQGMTRRRIARQLIDEYE